MIEEPPELAGEIQYWQRLLLGAILIRPAAISYRCVKKLDTSECHGLLGDVLQVLRKRPAISLNDLTRDALAGKHACMEVAAAVCEAMPWLADWYASRLLSLYAARREFWDAAKELHERQYKIWERCDKSRGYSGQ